MLFAANPFVQLVPNNSSSIVDYWTVTSYKCMAVNFPSGADIEVKNNDKRIKFVYPETLDPLPVFGLVVGVPEPLVDVGTEIVQPPTSHPHKVCFALFNDALSTFYLRSYGVGHMVNDQSDREMKPAASSTQAILFNCVGIIPQIGQSIPRPLLYQSWSTGLMGPL